MTDKDLVIVSMHEKGFPQADLYVGAADMPTDEFKACGMAPDNFFTMKRGVPLEAAFERAQATWPDALVVYADDEDDADA